MLSKDKCKEYIIKRLENNEQQKDMLDIDLFREYFTREQIKEIIKEICLEYDEPYLLNDDKPVSQDIQTNTISYANPISNPISSVTKTISNPNMIMQVNPKNNKQVFSIWLNKKELEFIGNRPISAVVHEAMNNLMLLVNYNKPNSIPNRLHDIKDTMPVSNPNSNNIDYSSPNSA